MMDTEWKRSNNPVLHKLPLVHITLSPWKSTVFKKSVVFHIDLADCTRRLWSKDIPEAHWHLLENWYYVGRRKLYIKHVNKQTHIQKCTCEKMHNYWWVQQRHEKGDNEKGVTIITTTQPTTDLPNFWLPFWKLWNKKSNNLNEDGKLLVRSSTNKINYKHNMQV